MPQSPTPTLGQTLAGCAAFLFLAAVLSAAVWLLTSGMPAPYLYGHCADCDRSYRTSSWRIPGDRLPTVCPHCGEYLAWPPLHSAGWNDNRKRFGD